MRRQPTRNERRILALAVLALLLWAAWQLLVASWFNAPMAELAEQAATLQAQHQRYARVLAQGPALQVALAQARQNPSARRSLLPGNDPSAAAADLMQAAVDRVKAVAALGPGCEVTQRMPTVPEADSGQAYRQVKVSLTLACASEPLMQLLHGLEYGQPYLFVEALSVHRNNDAPAAGGPGRLSVQLLLRGYLTGAAAAKEPRP